MLALDYEKLSVKSQSEYKTKFKVLYQKYQAVIARIEELEAKDKLQQDQLQFLKELLGSSTMRAVRPELQTSKEGRALVALHHQMLQQHWSEEALESKVFRDIMLTVFIQALETKKLSGTHLPPYPFGMDNCHDNWPKDKATSKLLVHFDWREWQSDSVTNMEGRKKVVGMMKAITTSHSKKVTNMINSIIAGKIEARVRDKFISMAAEYCKHHPASADNDNLGDVKPKVPDCKAMALCVKEKLESCIHKRDSLLCPEDLKNPRYNGALCINTMSDDKDDPDAMPGCLMKYISVAPQFRSDSVNY
ncbi:hypothetical protein CONPUDRAFT_71003 [Coniophora puteana RWD-64-598 SS2]|uniref:Uncharacterized protein n=1 Tax=Coniophora puteana (strain RWD-64-598) TaxID=741705 RepID=A0A5M3MZD3_CONPW|nr:uncharacterized protein CONPUDRAFT_71003 [Coniophora puteana RWD-64-598 SS2]EIW84164.1 hypothetical protein CONPUDRAFT_71003 [Coniophora puteana RWD-64-598 SS2]